MPKKCQNLTFNFLWQKLSESFPIFFSLKNVNLGAHFLLLTFFDNINLILKLLYFLKWCPIFGSLPLHQFSKFKNFLWVCWWLGKNLSNFIYPVWKLHNPYCHSTQSCKSRSSMNWQSFLKAFLGQAMNLLKYIKGFMNLI